ncbi:MFS transporter-like protein [Dothistroma septosporum NZE10]|uniref:MFS transporter-like protein n=1 Tax=Dothistroma septosporum (strain NZE10 / CBS 128990) TaxID=675120 RepID=N1PJS3_DOTSN|nr:MFS transporter-like protein [Dothistroma septosporum NZE10]
MAHKEDDFHFQMRGSPYHSRDQSIASGWRGHARDDSAASDFTALHRPLTQDSHRPFGQSNLSSSSSALVSNHERNVSDVVSPPPQAIMSKTDVNRVASAGFHPGYPGPESSTSLGPNARTWPTEPSLWMPSAGQHDDKDSSIPSTAKEYLSSAPPESTHVPSGPPGGPPPDGGTTAWLQVLAGYFLFFNTWGLINAFGVFQSYYKETLIRDQTNSTIAWIGTLTSFFLCASPISWGPVFDIGSPRLLVLFGSFSVALGIMMMSLCDQYWQLILAQGVCCGLGGGALFITATSVLPSYFSKKRALAMGISASGSSLGGVIYPIVFTYTQPTVGFGWAVRIVGFIAILTLAIPCIVIKPRAKPPGRRKIFDASILAEIPFEFMNVATFFGFIGQYIPYFFIEQYAAQHDLDFQFWMLIFLNVGSIPGRIIPSLVADKLFHPLKVLATTTAVAAILAFCWVAIKHSTPGLIVWCFLYGFCSGAFVSLQGAAVASMTTDLRTIGTRFGINMFAGALGILIGSPVGGAIFPESWPGAQSFCGATLLCATLAIIGTWFSYQRSLRSRAVGKGVA